MQNEDKGQMRKGILENPWVGKLAALFLIMATVFMAAKAVNAVINFDAITTPPSNVITVTGEGKVSSVPDIAQISFTVSEEAVTASGAQDVAAKKINVALAVLKEKGVAEKDIKTSSYNISPRYSYQPPCYTYPCPYNEAAKIIGFTASQTVEVKVRDIDKTGDVLSALGDAGVANLYGPNFMIEDEDALQAEAREKAIMEARAQAEQLAKALGVRVTRVVSYNENGGYPGPMYRMDSAMALGGAEKSVPSIPAGENEIMVSVSVTYEVR
jgi:uncharacterized protein YggE